MGLSPSGVKAEMALRLASVANTDPSQFDGELRHLRPVPVRSIVSMDLGLKNFAFAHLDLTSVGHVREWRRIEVHSPSPYHPAPFAAVGVALAARLPAADLYLIEAQRHRSGGAATVIEHAIKLRLLEVLLHAQLLGRAASVQPKRVAGLFELPEGRGKKKDAVVRARTIIADSMREGMLSFAPEAKNAFEEETKRDDMSDALLQALAVIRWRKAADEFRNIFEEKSQLELSA